MSLTRRGFLAGFAVVGAAGILVPELLVPKRTYFLPPRAGWRGYAGPIEFDDGLMHHEYWYVRSIGTSGLTPIDTDLIQNGQVANGSIMLGPYTLQKDPVIPPLVNPWSPSHAFKIGDIIRTSRPRT